MTDWATQCRLRGDAAKLIFDQPMRVALWKLVMEAKPRNHLWAARVSEWLLDLDQREPDRAPSRQQILAGDAR